jgi:ribosomal protein L12E/L44/L45/RPP1/RPP2
MSLTALPPPQIMNGLSKGEKGELAVALAACILVDSDSEVSSKNIEKLLAAAEVETESYWPMMFSGFCNSNDIIALIGTPATGGGGGGGGGGAGAAAGGAAEEEKKEEEKEKEESEDMGGGMGMFGEEEGGGGGGGGGY